MEISEFSFLGGVLLGLASTLHCAGMCGGIATSIVLLFNPETAGDRVRVLMLSQAGRISGYVAAGAMLGAFGSGLYGAFNAAGAYRVLQWAAAAAVVWLGLTLAGLVPMPAAVDRLVAKVSAVLARWLAPLRRSALGPYFAGLTWGIIPCPMVYAALFTAMLAGSALGGAVVMAGFGLATLVPVTLTALGIASLARIEAHGPTRLVVGLGIALLGASTVLPGSPTSSVFCAPPPAIETR